MTIGEKIKSAREAARLTQTELGAACGTTKQTIYKYETGTVTNIPLDRLELIAKAVDVPAAELMGWTEKDALRNEGLANLDKKAPSLSDEAMQIAKDYSVLDHWGKTAVRELVSTEKQRCEDEARFLADTQLIPFEPKVVNLFLEPSAAGIAAPVEGKDFEPYELQPDEPQGAAYAIRVQGDSMEPDFPDGSIVFVNHDAIANGDIGVFCVDGGTVIKQYYHDPLGMTYLFSLNRKRADADVLIRPSSGQTVVCQGRVITKRRYPLPRM